MSELERIEQLEKEIRALKGLNEEGIPSYAFSSIKFKTLQQFLTVKQNFIEDDRFDIWFGFKLTISKKDTLFLQKLIDKNIKLINLYHEEDLKVNFIVPLINKIDYFLIKDNIRNYYNEKLTYKTSKFIFNGETDFLIAKGIVKSQKPYFFIQEFKKGKTPSDPEPQLLAELISAVELNREFSMKGAFIVGAIWNFVVLEKLGEDNYQYFVSQNFDSTKIDDLKGIYKNLMFIKNEILQKVKEENNLR